MEAVTHVGPTCPHLETYTHLHLGRMHSLPSALTVFLFPLIAHRLIRITLPMSQAPYTPTSSSNFQSIFNAALKAYEKKTKNNLLAHPLAAQLQACNSPADILSILQDRVKELNQSRSADERLSRWLNPTISVLYAFSATLGEVGPIQSTCLHPPP